MDGNVLEDMMGWKDGWVGCGFELNQAHIAWLGLRVESEWFIRLNSSRSFDPPSLFVSVLVSQCVGFLTRVNC